MLVACEFSGVVRRAFAARGHDAWSCDLLPAEDRSNHHIVGDVRDILDDGWDLLIAVENPVMHRHAKARIDNYAEPAQSIQPWQFGHGETKRTCLWLRKLPPLVPTNIVEGREPRVHRLPPSPDRWRERSRFYPGIAEAMADQWGGFAEGREAA